MSAREVVVDLRIAETKIDAAAAALVPVMTGTTTDPTEISKAVHDALNHLATARLNVEVALGAALFDAVTS